MIERVIQLNYLNVYLIISKGLVNAFSFAAVKNTLMFSIERGKNLTKAIRETPKTMLAWILPGRLLKIEPIECIICHKGKMMNPLIATMQ